MNIITLTLINMAHGGDAVGRHEGRAVFVPFGIPGETVRARITQDKGRFARAEIVEVLETAPIRVDPRCKHFGKCGGCHGQHIAYEAQLEFKRQVVADQLARIGGLREVTVHPTLPSPDPYNYRSHVTFKKTPDGQLGFVSTDGRTVIPVDECHLVRPEIASLSFQRAASSDHLPNTKQARLRVQAGSTGEPIIFPLDSNQDDDSSYSVLSPQSSALSVAYTIKGHTFRCSAGSFFQVNLPQAEKLVELVLERLALSGSERVLDLYSGVGLFTAFLAQGAVEVSAVEAFPPAVADAMVNLDSFDNVDLYEGTIEAVLPALKGKFDAAVIDPPRSGMDAPALTALIKRAPKRLVYVSCDPATLARDAKKLVASGYTLRDVQPVDMFPQTYHVESVALFLRA